MISKEDIEFLNNNRQHWDIWQRAQVFNHLDYGIRLKLLEIIHTYWSPVYNVNLWCSPCVVDMLRFAYTQYDKYLLSIENDKPINDNSNLV